jgi:erythritol kinase (D-erythritol 1-phosphate-forming)
VTSIGVDVGTSVVKAVRFADDLTPEATASVAVTLSHEHPGWSELDPSAVWAAVERVVTEIALPAVDLVAVTAQGDGCWLVDSQGQPARPAMLWNDARSSDIVDRWQAQGLLDDAFRATGSYGNSGLANAQLAWLRQNEPETLVRAETLLSAGSWVWLQLTGQRGLHVSDACNPLLSAVSGEYDLDLLDRFGLGWAARLLPQVLAHPVAELLPAVAARLGLRPGTPVALGPYDVVSSALGVGAVQVGAGFGILGTTLCIGAVAGDPALDREPAGMSLSTGWGARWLLAYATLAGTGVLDWGSRLLGITSAADLVALAATSTTDEPPLLLPYLSPAGERAPFRDSQVRGSLLGLTLEHTPADVARGALEGLSLAVRDCLVASGQQPESLSVCGGGSRSAAWCQLLADVTGTTVRTADTDEVGARGAVLAGLVATGRFHDVDEAVAILRAGAVFVPESPATQRFDALYERFVDARQRV